MREIGQRREPGNLLVGMPGEIYLNTGGEAPTQYFLIYPFESPLQIPWFQFPPLACFNV
jgi:hypothetical protein